jgi:hypothetical protein
MRNYPKNRKCPKGTLKAELLEKHDINEIFKIWYLHGIYKAARLLETSYNVIYYLARRNSWKRPLPQHLLIGYQRGNWQNLRTNFINPNQTKNNVN